MKRLILLGLLVSGAAQAQAAVQTPTALPAFSHVFLFVFENKSAETILGNRHPPTFNKLAQEGALALNSHGVTHPSLPNYVAMIAGTDFGTHSDNPSQKFYGPTLPEALEKAGLTWKGYFQSIPAVGFRGSYGGTFWVYVKRHNPFMLFPALADDPAWAANSVPLGQLPGDLSSGRAPNFALIVPDVCHDMHCNVNCFNKEALFNRADAFLAEWVNAIRRSPAWDEKVAIIITFDEAEASDTRSGGGRIPTIVLTKTGPQGFQSETFYNHYSLLRTLTDAWGLAPIGNPAKATPMTELFVPSTPQK